MKQYATEKSTVAGHRRGSGIAGYPACVEWVHWWVQCCLMPAACVSVLWLVISARVCLCSRLKRCCWFVGLEKISNKEEEGATMQGVGGGGGGSGEKLFSGGLIIIFLQPHKLHIERFLMDGWGEVIESYTSFRGLITAFLKLGNNFK